MYASLKLSPGKKHETSGKMCCEQYIAPRRKETNIYPNAQTQASRLPNPHFTPSNSSEKYHCSIAPETELAQGSEFLKMNSQKTEFLKLFPDESQCAAAQRIFRTNRTFENFALLKELVRTSSYHVDVYVCQTFWNQSLRPFSICIQVHSSFDPEGCRIRPCFWVYCCRERLEPNYMLKGAKRKTEKKGNADVHVCHQL